MYMILGIDAILRKNESMAEDTHSIIAGKWVSVSIVGAKVKNRFNAAIRKVENLKRIFAITAFESHFQKLPLKDDWNPIIRRIANTRYLIYHSKYLAFIHFD